jgi:glycerophosphoryl diester phosphodiesterase
VNDGTLAKQLLSLGVDGVMTDHSDLFNETPTKNY